MQRRKACEAFRERLGQPLEVGWQKLGLAVVPGCSLDRPRRGRCLVHAEEHAAPLLTQVHLAVQIHHYRELPRRVHELGQILGDQIVMLHGHEGEFDAHHVPDLASPESAGVDNVLGLDGALVGDDEPAALTRPLELEDPRVTVDLGPADSRGLCERMSGPRRIEVALHRIPYRPQDSARVHDRAKIADLLRADQPRVEPERRVSSDFAPQQIEALPGRGHIEPAGIVEADILAGQELELAIEPDGVGLQPCHGGVGVQGVDGSRRMPARAGGQVLALAEDHVLPAATCQMIENAAADDAATDDHDLTMRFHETRTLIPGQVTGSIAPDLPRRLGRPHIFLGDAVRRAASPRRERS